MQNPNLNLPNALTVFRLVLIPPILISFLGRFPDNHVVAFALFVVASISDSLDGRIARRYATVITVGKFVDPLADKLLILAVLAMLSPFFPGSITSGVTGAFSTAELPDIFEAWTQRQANNRHQMDPLPTQGQQRADSVITRPPTRRRIMTASH